MRPILFCILPMLAAAMSGAAPKPTDHVRQERDYVQVEVKGRISRAASTQDTGFRIGANDLTWDLDVSANEELRRAAERLEGEVAVVSGTYHERKRERRAQRVVVVQSLAPAAGRSHPYVQVTVRGTLRTGVVAIGAETTGATITADGVTWELELDRGQRQRASTLSGSKAVVSGRLRYQRGVEIDRRPIVNVERLQ